MQQLEVQRRFRAPADKVWDAYTNHADWQNWAGFSKSWLETKGSPDPNGLGCVRGFYGNGITVYEEVVEWEPKSRFVYRIVRGGPPVKNHQGEVLFAPEGDGTLVTWRCRFDPALPVPGLGWLLRLVIERVFRTALAGLAKRHFPDR